MYINFFNAADKKEKLINKYKQSDAMVSKAGAVQSTRDILAIIGAFIVAYAIYNKFNITFVKYFVIIAAILWLILSFVDLMLIIFKRKYINYFFANTIFQFAPSAILMIIGMSRPKLFIMGLLLLVLNIIMIKILADQKKIMVKKESVLSTANKIIQYIRDVILVIVSIAIMSTSYGKWINEPAIYVLFLIGIVIGILSIVNVMLLLMNVRNRAYFYFNSIMQLIIALILMLAGATAPLGIILIIVNTTILITLRRKKEAKS